MQVARAVLVGNGPQHDGAGWNALAGSPYLTPVANRPVLMHVLERLSLAGVIEATIAVDGRVAADVRDVLDAELALDLRADVMPTRPSLAARAVLSGMLPALHDEPVLVAKADAVVMAGLGPVMADFARTGLDAQELRFTADGEPAGWLLSRRALPMLASRAGAGRARGVLDVVDACGGNVGVADLDGLLVCDAGQESLLEGNRRLLRDLRDCYEPGQLPGSRIQGPVELHPTARVERSLIRGPVVVGAGARLVDAYVGPYTSIGADVVVEGSEVEHSIVMDGTHISFVGARIETSVIGPGARIARRFELPSAVRLWVGRAAEVAL